MNRKYAVSFGLLLFVTNSGGQTQNQPSLHASTFCIKATPGKGQEFEQFMMDVGHKLAQWRVDNKKMAGMTLSRAVAPMGEDARCGYLLAYFYEGAPPEPQMGMLAEELKKAGTNLTVQEYVARRDSLSKLASHARYVRYAGFGETNKGDYWQVNMMKPRPGKTGEFYEFERKTWMPLAKEAAERGHARKAWSGWHMLYPSGTGLEATGVTVDVFRDWASIWNPQGYSKEVVEKVFPGKSLDELFKPLSELRDLVRRELYVQIDNVRPSSPDAVSGGADRRRPR